MAKLNIVLFEPEIPANTGNIGRTCVATGTRLHLIEPLGFKLNEKAIKRAGMDYWKDLDVTTYINYEDFLKKIQVRKFIWQLQKDLRLMLMCIMKRTAILCLEKKAVEFRRNFAGKPGNSNSYSNDWRYPFFKSK